jgi:hypothetical protein
MVNDLINKYRELGITKTESHFLLEIMIKDGYEYLESEASYSYTPSTIKKIRKSLKEKGLIDWTVRPIFSDLVYTYNLSNLENKLATIEENKKKPNILEYLQIFKKEN